MNYVLDENGNIKIGPNGKPLVKGADGEEFELDAIGQTQTLIVARTEARDFRKQRNKLQTELDAIPEEVRKDPSVYVESHATVGSMGDKQKTDMDKLKADLKTSYETSHAAEIKKKDDRIVVLDGQLYNEKVTTKFATAKALDGTIFNKVRSVAQDTFKSRFAVGDDGKLIGKNMDGSTIYSRENPGQSAGFNESLEVIINTHPDKDNFLSPSNQKGSGNPPNNRQAGDESTGALSKIKGGLAARKAA